MVICVKIDFTGKKVLITGASRGIGRQIADDMKLLGAELILTATKEELNYHCVDFLSGESTNKFIDFLSKEKIDICINNAGINKISSICDTDIRDWDDILQVNLSAPFKILKTVATGMKRRKYGRIINISSIWGTISKEQRASYSSSKFGLRGLTMASAAELAKYNVLINAVSPGFTLTDLTKSILTETEMREICSQIPIERMAEPSEISKVVLFLASDLNTYISGQNIVVDGGFVNV